jgi:hypothetical protein
MEDSEIEKTLMNAVKEFFGSQKKRTPGALLAYIDIKHPGLLNRRIMDHGSNFDEMIDKVLTKFGYHIVISGSEGEERIALIEFDPNKKERKTVSFQIDGDTVQQDIEIVYPPGAYNPAGCYLYHSRLIIIYALFKGERTLEEHEALHAYLSEQTRTLSGEKIVVNTRELNKLYPYLELEDTNDKSQLQEVFCCAYSELNDDGSDAHAPYHLGSPNPQYQLYNFIFRKVAIYLGYVTRKDEEELDESELLEKILYTKKKGRSDYQDEHTRKINEHILNIFWTWLKQEEK